MNQWLGSGNLAADPEIKTSAKGTTIATFTVGCRRRFKVEGQPESDFIRCVAFNKTAEFVAKWFKKGSGIEVSGELNIRKYSDSNGVTKYIAEIAVDNVSFGAGGSGNKENTGGDAPTSQATKSKAVAPPEYESDDDLPF